MSHSVAGKPGLDPTLPDVSVKIAGQTYQLVFSFNSICVVESLTGINLLKASISDVSAVNVRALLYAALLPTYPDMTLEAAGNMVTMRNVGTLHNALISAWFGSIETDSDAEDNPSGEATAQPKG
jgi:hypothetical protein